MGAEEEDDEEASAVEEKVRERVTQALRKGANEDGEDAGEDVSSGGGIRGGTSRSVGVPVTEPLNDEIPKSDELSFCKGGSASSWSPHVADSEDSTARDEQEEELEDGAPDTRGAGHRGVWGAWRLGRAWNAGGAGAIADRDPASGAGGQV